MTEKEFDSSVLDQKPSNWLPSHIEYEGEGSAEFQNPKGRVGGKTKVVFDEFNEYSIEMQVDGLESDRPLPLGLNQLISETPPSDVAGKLTLPLMPEKYNLCTKLSVKTQEGEFIAENIEWLSTSFAWNVETGQKETLYFHPPQSRFDTTNSNPAHFWVMPLINFISDFMQYDESLSNHPLRIFPDATIPPNIPADQREIAEHVVRQKSRLILFEFNKALGFIEALPDYKEKESLILKKQIPSAITSVMVAEIGNNPIDLNGIQQWFPFFLLDLLGLECGNEVSIPWIEFRDNNGKLVRRVHGFTGFGHSLFISGQRAIDEVMYKGRGKLLSVAQTCPDLHESYLLVAIRHTILGGRNSQSLEDKLDHFCRALDDLCEYHKLSQQNLLCLTPDKDKAVIHNAISQSSLAIQSIIQAAQASGDLAQSRYLQTVLGRLTNTTNQERKFGLGVCDLLIKFSLPDADILDIHFANNPRNDNLKKWADVLSHYRGRVIHTGFFNFKTNEHQFEDIWSVIQHLHDILLRVLLLTLGYNGEYNPPVMKYRTSKPLDWVKPDTSAAELGYK
jgi:hypothetical protein